MLQALLPLIDLNTWLIFTGVFAAEMLLPKGGVKNCFSME